MREAGGWGSGGLGWGWGGQREVCMGGKQRERLKTDLEEKKKKAGPHFQPSRPPVGASLGQSSTR